MKSIDRKNVQERRSSDLIDDVVEFIEEYLSYGPTYLTSLETWMTTEADSGNIDVTFTDTTTFGQESLDKLATEMYNIMVLCPSDSSIVYGGENGFVLGAGTNFQVYGNGSTRVDECCPYTYTDLITDSSYDNLRLLYRYVISNSSFGDWFEIGLPYDQRLFLWYISAVTSSEEYVLNLVLTVFGTYSTLTSKKYIYNEELLGVLTFFRSFEVVQEYIIERNISFTHENEIIFVVWLENGKLFYFQYNMSSFINS